MLRIFCGVQRLARVLLDSALLGLAVASCDEGPSPIIIAAPDGPAPCVTPVDCTKTPDVCAQPSERGVRCTPNVAMYQLTECSNGYVIVHYILDAGGAIRYYRDRKLVAVYGGHLGLVCMEGPADFVLPECTPTRVVNLCLGQAFFSPQSGSAGGT